VLSGLVSHEDSAVRAAAVRALGRLGAPGAVEPLLLALDDEDGAVRQAAPTALNTIGDWRAAPWLIEALDDPAARVPAAYALGRIGSSTAVKPLIERLGDADPEMRKAAATALGALNAEAAAPALLRLLSDDDEELRSVAITALGRIDSPRSVAALRRAYGRSHSCRERFLIRRILALRGKAGRLAPIEDGANDLCVVCGRCSVIRCPVDGRFYCNEHRDRCAGETAPGGAG
jgi:HEAT repeat protein